LVLAKPNSLIDPLERIAVGLLLHNPGAPPQLFKHGMKQNPHQLKQILDAANNDAARRPRTSRPEHTEGAHRTTLSRLKPSVHETGTTPEQ
jgi:hypothetical protein